MRRTMRTKFKIIILFTVDLVGALCGIAMWLPVLALDVARGKRKLWGHARHSVGASGRFGG